MLVVAGFEGSGRMGLLADTRAVAARGGVPFGVVSALTVQRGRGAQVQAVLPVRVVAQLEAAEVGAKFRALKLGMVPNRPVLRTVLPAVHRVRPCVVDPVVLSSRGLKLSSLTPSDFRSLALPWVILTPNLPELFWLLGKTSGDLEGSARQLLAWGFRAVVVKGGHAEGSSVSDLLVTRGGIHRMTGRRMPRSANHRGTGCRFASALATELAKGASLSNAVERARTFVRAYLAADGRGP